MTNHGHVLAMVAMLLPLGACAATRGHRSVAEDGPPANVGGWPAAVRSIADEVECPLYRGLRIRPQEGLTPWRRNPVSGLWEFLVDETGSAPKTNAYGGIESAAADAVVLVLVPVGSSRSPLALVPSDGDATPKRAFFLATHELSVRQARAWYELDAPVVDRDGANPYVYVTRGEADLMLRARGMRLPTETEWEFAATAFEGASWWTKVSIEEQCRYVRGNIADGTLRQTYSLYVDHQQEAADGEALLAPCGRFGPGAAGFYDMAGNVEEWVTAPDDVGVFGTDEREGRAVTKGGSFLSRIDACRPDARAIRPPVDRRGTIGLRVARSLR